MNEQKETSGIMFGSWIPIFDDVTQCYEDRKNALWVFDLLLYSYLILMGIPQGTRFQGGGICLLDFSDIMETKCNLTCKQKLI